MATSNTTCRTIAILTFTLVITSMISDVEVFVCNKPLLELGVAPVSKKMQVFWRLETQHPSPWIGVYSKKPNKDNPDDNLLEKFDVTELTGWHTTEQVFSKKAMAFDRSTVLGFWAAFWTKGNKKDEVVIWTPYESYPQWMKYYWYYIKDRPINTLFIPGTHDSSSYEGIPDRNGEKTTAPNSFKDKLINMANKASQIMQKIPVIRDLTLTQDQSIQEQLLMGIRYLDMRVLKHKDGNYWTSHSFYVMEELDKILTEVVEFIERTEREIVIFDIHQLVRGIRTDYEQVELVDYLKNKLKKRGKALWVPPFQGKTWSNTIENIYNTGGRIIVAYNNATFQEANNYGILWPPVHHYWGNKQEIDDLYNFFEDTFSGNRNPDNTLTAAMAELTGTAMTVYERYKDGLNDQAERNGAKIHSWFLQPKFGMHTNVLAVDYFRAMGVVRLAFLWNVRIGSNNGNPQCDPQESVNDKYYEEIFIP